MALRVKLRTYRWTLLGVVGALLACAVLAPAMGGQASEFLMAKARWDARAFTSYQLVVQEETEASSCRQASEIRAERIDRVLQNRCVRLPSWTVSNLFLWAEQSSSLPARCYPSAVTCVCYKVNSLRTTYDPLLGYPQRVTHAWSLRFGPTWATGSACGAPASYQPVATSRALKKDM
ncbi:MAG: hypothetical protein M3R61_08195 [Chloroflexota bacterium]|nr:hypothetical protein [Chloroflexota bacterium]